MPYTPPIMSTLLVVEHCERGLSDWLFLEYRHAATIWEPDVLFTNVSSKTATTKLLALGHVTREPVNTHLKGRRCIILDPKATTPLSTRDFTRLHAIVIGGILGYKNPRGRTKTLISDHSSFETRHIGPIQLTIDGAALVAKAVALGLRIKDIEIAYEVEITHDAVRSTILPFGYPILEGNPIITPGLIEYLTRKDEQKNKEKKST